MRQGIHISDVFLGYRNAPHFVIAVKHDQGGEPWILRATMDTAFFNEVVGDIGKRISVDAYLVNEKGIYQTQPPHPGRLMGPSGVEIPHHQGIEQQEVNGRIRVMVRLDRAPWICVVQTERKIIFSQLYQIRNISIGAFIMGAILMVLTILLTTNYLIARLEWKRKSIRALNHQLEHTSRLASAMRLSAGLFQEVKDALGNIDAIARWIQDLAQRDLSSENVLGELKDSAAQIQSQVFGCHKAIDNFLDGTRQAVPVITGININEQLDGLVKLLDRELRFSNITIARNYQETPAPLVRSDPSRLRQVFQNLILNAMEASRQNGKIFLTTQLHEDLVYVRITDQGPGIPEKDLETIFDPAPALKAGDAELRLPLCRRILTKLGGRIFARNEPEKGTTLVVEIPVKFDPEPGKLDIQLKSEE